MIKYNWEKHQDWITEEGYNLKKAYHKDMIAANEFSKPSEKKLITNRETYRSLLNQRTRLNQPCLFISHRQKDDQEAMRVAYIATKLGYNIYLDILDHRLHKISHSYLIANRIEVALLNSTHVIALITPNTKGSMWVPYEYGRVKEFKVLSSVAACWIHPKVKTPVAEYLYLGELTRSEADISSWLRQELKNFNSVSQKRWRYGPTLKLPQKATIKQSS